MARVSGAAWQNLRGYLQGESPVSILSSSRRVDQIRTAEFPTNFDGLQSAKRCRRICS